MTHHHLSVTRRMTPQDQEEETKEKLKEKKKHDYLYPRHEDVTTCGSLKNHTFRDVTRTPKREFESATSDLTPQTITKPRSMKEAWICHIQSENLLEDDKRKMDKLMGIQEYNTIPFPEDGIHPYEWIHTLSTIDVCTLPPQTQFCDKNGYEIVRVRVVTIVDNKRHDSNCPKDLTALKIGPDDVSLVDMSKTNSDYIDLEDNSDYLQEIEVDSQDDQIVPAEKLEKIRNC